MRIELRLVMPRDGEDFEQCPPVFCGASIIEDRRRSPRESPWRDRREQRVLHFDGPETLALVSGGQPRRVCVKVRPRPEARTINKDISRLSELCQTRGGKRYTRRRYRILQNYVSVPNGNWVSNRCMHASLQVAIDNLTQYSFATCSGRRG